MLKVEIKERTIVEESKEQVKKHLVINDVSDEESFYIGFGPLSAHFYKEEVINIIISNSFEEIGKSFSKVGFAYEFDWWKTGIDFDIVCGEYYSKVCPSIKATIMLDDWEHWANPWSMADLAKEFQNNVNLIGDSSIKYWQDEPDSMLNGFGIEYYSASDKMIIENELDSVSELIEALIEKTNIGLVSAIDSNSIVTYFKFPDEIKAACQQYLVYFAQFMADLGAKVDVALKEQMEYTLFKITPKDESDGLARIYEALGVYLNAPGQNNFAVQVAAHSDLAVKQWEANYYHLKSQIVLANSIIQAKEVTIDMLQLTNYQYKQLIDLGEAKKDEKEDVIKGIVALKKFEGKGFVIDFAEILRRLKRVIKL